MKVVIVNCFDTYEDRVLLLKDYFEKRGNAVRVITSDYRHFKKEYRTEKPKGFIFVHARSYTKNLSADRLLSHDKFAREAIERAKRLKPNLLWVLAPPNSLVKQAAHYRKKDPNLKLVIDLIDMWPETMPMGHINGLPPFMVWRHLRDGFVDAADIIVTECSLYKKVLKGKCEPGKIKTLYLAKREAEIACGEETGMTGQANPEKQLADQGKAVPEKQSSDQGEFTPPTDRISLCYIGSINNIIDIPCIAEIIRSLPSREKKPLLHIIGDGEKKEELISTARLAGAEVVYHGKVYDEAEKQKVFDRCHFGLNIMKPDVFVGLTMKSIDYFAGGLPVINNIGGDTRRLVEKYGIGVNVLSSELKEEWRSDLIQAVNSDNEEYRLATKKLFDEKFRPESFEARLDRIFEASGIITCKV